MPAIRPSLNELSIAASSAAPADPAGPMPHGQSSGPPQGPRRTAACALHAARTLHGDARRAHTVLEDAPPIRPTRMPGPIPRFPAFAGPSTTPLALSLPRSGVRPHLG